MSDLIKREDALKKNVGLDMQVYEGDTFVGIRTFLTKEEIIYAINDIPSAEPERKKGKWVFEDGKPVNRTLKMGEIAVCDQCGKKAPGYPFWECDLELTNFCPNCGADMRGE